MTQAKIEGKFYPLQHKEWIKVCKELSSGARDVLYFIRTADPYSNGVEVTAAAIAKELGVNRSTVSRALKELDSKGYIEMEIVSAKVAVTGKGLLETATDECCKNAEGVAKMQQPKQNRNKPRKNATSHAKMHHESAELQHTTSETLTKQEFQPSKTLQTKKDFFQTLSESEEREKKELLISESSFLQEKSEKDKAKAENIAFFNSLNGLQKEAVIRTAHKYFLPRLNQYPSLPLMWIKCHAIEIAHTDACNQEIDLIDAELASESEAKYTLQDIQEMYPDCWKEMLPYFGSLLAF
ncbi:MAG: helix-turn-helix transcriptional regulator [Microcoleaceae cyanobacterium]